MADTPFTGSKWGPSSQFGSTGGTVTYSFNLEGARFYGFDASIVGDYFQSIVRSAFDLWESIARIDFQEITGPSANIQVGIDAFDGRGGTLGEARWSYVGNTTTHAEVALDSAEVWNAFVPGASNLYAVLVHEIGHTIGLEHVSDPNSIMYPYLGTQSGPSASDIAAIQGLYGAAAPLGNLIYGTPGTEIVNGTNAKDRIDAGAGDDIVNGYFGADLIYGGDGNDTIFGNQDNDTIYGGFGADLIYGGLGDDQVYGNQGDDQISGSTGNDSVYGGFGNDFMFGDDGNDALYGGPGNDTLHGGTGDDTLNGGAGADLFRFAANNGRDVIVDFRASEGDRISLGGQGYFVSEANGSAVVNLPGGGTITLLGVTAASLDPVALVA